MRISRSSGFRTARWRSDRLCAAAPDEYLQIKPDFLAYLEEQNLQHHYDLLLILFTDPKGSGSHFLYTGKKGWVIEEGFKTVLTAVLRRGFISRKKQVLPVVIDTLNK